MTEGGSNVELGDLEVKAIRADELESHLKQKRQVAKKVTEKAANRAGSLLDTLKALDEQFERARRELAEARSKRESVEELESEVAERMPDVSQIDELYATSKARLQQSPFGATITDIEMGESLTPIGQEDEFYRVTYSGKKGYVYASYLLTKEQYESYRKDQKEVAQLVSGTESRYAEAQERCKTIKDSLFTDMPIDYDELRTREQVPVLRLLNEDKVDAEDLQAPEFIEITSRFRTFDYYFQDLPKPKDTDRTNSAGEFELTLTQGTSYYLVAEGRRSIGDKTEKYYWMVETTLEGENSEVILSNSNVDTELPDSLDVVVDAPIDTERLIKSVTACE